MGDGSLSQDEIDALLSMGDDAPAAGGASGSSGGDVDLSSLLGGEAAGGDNLGADALSQLANALGPAPTPTAAPAPRTATATRTADNMSLLMDVRVRFIAELGRTNMYIKDVLLLGEGSIVELDKVVGDEVDLIVNDSPFGRGRLVVIDEFLGVQITHIYDPMARLRGLI